MGSAESELSEKGQNLRYRLNAERPRTNGVGKLTDTEAVDRVANLAADGHTLETLTKKTITIENKQS